MFNWYTPVIKHVLLENGPFVSDFPIKTSMYREFSIGMLDDQRVNHLQRVHGSEHEELS